MATLTARPITLEEFRALPEGPPHFEFENGEIIPASSPTPTHQDIVTILAFLLWQFVRKQNLGRAFREVDVTLPDGRVYSPDLSFLSTGRLHLLSLEDEKIHGTPNLVVEVTSSESERDRVHKFRVYYENEVPWYWIVDSETLTIEEYQGTPDGYLRTASIAAGEEFRPKLFEGLGIDLARLLETGVMN